MTWVLNFSPLWLKLYFPLPVNSHHSMNLHNVFQLKQALIAFKCNMGKSWNMKGPIHACVARCLSKEIGNVLRAALVAGSAMGFDSSTCGACPPPKSAGIRVCGDLSLPLLNTCSAEVKILIPTLSWREKNPPISRGQHFIQMSY